MVNLFYLIFFISSLLFAQEIEQTQKVIEAIKKQPELIEKIKETIEEEIKEDKIGRGDAIIVPEKQIRRPTGDIIKDVAQVLYQLGFSATAIVTLIK